MPAPVTGLAFDAAGLLWVTGGEPGRPPGYIWRVSPDGTAEEWARIPGALFLNGCAVLAPHRVLLAAESLTGRILAVDQQAPGWSTWIEHDSLRPTSVQAPGANGIKVGHGWAWVSVTDRDTILRVQVRPDGSAGQPHLVAEALRGRLRVRRVRGDAHRHARGPDRAPPRFRRRPHDHRRPRRGSRWQHRVRLRAG
jgi:hypothetical protein